MSLINDALKRAKQVQMDAPESSSGPPLRPVEPATYVRHGVGIAVPISITLLALVGLLVLWQMYQRKEKDQLSYSSQTITQPAVTSGEPTREAASQPAPTAASPGTRAPVVAATLATTADTKAPSAQAPITQTPPENNGALAPAVAAAPQQADNTNILTAAQPVIPKPAPLRLQGIVYDLKRPSAVINGKTLFLRDRIGEFRVAAIRQDSVTVVSVSRTNLLTLEP
jgi:hypothetical protein